MTAETSVSTIISLTTIQSRLSTLPFVVRSILTQSVSDFRLRIHYSTSAFLLDPGISRAELEDSLKPFLTDPRLELVETENTGPYRKLIPVLQQFGFDRYTIVTADDDTLYPRDWLSTLLEASRRNPRAIICYRARLMIKKNEREFLSYRRWPLILGRTGRRYRNSVALLPTGRDGVLYPPHSLPTFVLDEEFRKLAPKTDDIWFRLCSLANRTPCLWIDREQTGMDSFYESRDARTVALYQDNCAPNLEGNNDSAIQGTADYLIAKNRLKPEVLSEIPGLGGLILFWLRKLP